MRMSNVGRNKNNYVSIWSVITDEQRQRHGERERRRETKGEMKSLLPLCLHAYERFVFIELLRHFDIVLHTHSSVNRLYRWNSKREFVSFSLPLISRIRIASSLLSIALEIVLCALLCTAISFSPRIEINSIMCSICAVLVHIQQKHSGLAAADVWSWTNERPRTCD